MENLRTYPVVQKAAGEGRLHVHAWYFEIGTGTVFRYSPEKEQFEPIREEKSRRASDAGIRSRARNPECSHHIR